jgi:hypothetical protein
MLKNIRAHGTGSGVATPIGGHGGSNIVVRKYGSMSRNLHMTHALVVRLEVSIKGCRLESLPQFHSEPQPQPPRVIANCKRVAIQPGKEIPKLSNRLDWVHHAVVTEVLDHGASPLLSTCLSEG